MALAFIFTLLGQILPLAGDEFREDTFIRMRQHEVYLREQMTDLLQEVDHSGTGMLALLFAVLSCVFGLLFWFIWKIEKKFWEDQDNDDEESCSSEEEYEQELEQEVEVLKKQEQEEEEVEGLQKELEDQEEKKQQEHTEMEELEKEEEEAVVVPTDVLSHQEYGEIMLFMLHELIKVSQFVIEDTFYPMPEHPIVVGSTYNGWSLPEEEPIFCFVPFRAPRGHIFRLDLGTTRELPVKNSRIRVELKCTCGQKQKVGMLCFLHTSNDELRNQSPSLLDTLCTGSYLDVRKTACWFQALFTTSWRYLPEAAICSLNVKHFKRSCRLQLTDSSNRTTVINIVFGVQQANTDIFLSSQKSEAAYTPNTTWPQTCAVAEEKFFMHIAAHAGVDNFYLRYVKVCAYILVGYNFSTHELKTVLMHLLTTIPVECWSQRYFVQRMEDILHYLHCCVKEKRLDHFLIGNKAVPAEIILPREFQLSRPPNLFQHLTQDPDRHEQALYETEMLQDRFETLLTSGK